MLQVDVLEGFETPEVYDIPTLQRLNRLCRCLKGLRWPSHENITQATTLAKSVEKEDLASAALKRHIKQFAYIPEKEREAESSTAHIDHQRALWYVLDSLVKDPTSNFKFYLQEEIISLISDCMPYKLPAESKKYKALMDSWIGVFDPTYLLQITEIQHKWVTEIDYGGDLPDEGTAQKKSTAGAKRVLDFSPPCHEYLQGTCTDDHCALQHPIGEEGSLPAEAKPGDWRCTFCATINRHFRRRCTSCPTEKTQYYCRRGETKSNITFRNEVSVYPTIVPSSDPRFDCLRAQFGYDFMDEAAAKKYWDSYFEMTDIDQWEHDRSLFYRMRILKKAPQTEEEEEISSTLHFPDISSIHAHQTTTSMHIGEWKGITGGGKLKPSVGDKPRATSGQKESSSMSLPNVPAMAASSQVAWIHKTLKESGVKGKHFPGYLCQFCLCLKKGIIEEKGFRHLRWLGVIIVDIFRTAFHSFLLFKRSLVETMRDNNEQQSTPEEESHPLLEAKRILSTFDSFHAMHHPAYPLCSDLRRFLKLIPVPQESAWELEKGTLFVLEKSKVTEADPLMHFAHAPQLPMPSEGLFKGMTAE
ncbi:hypothetical protein XU18_2002 [Perkinsela sp. CCAP 1560/4]|nr:hypothetical protein XU18_2002 [Perkinsela sp. CCAP 1560/4]|eukprot:KNH07470.1 hypothetical protein XU18_2002 [Perkinsela sp. CCAP 1560/4]